MAKKQFDMNRYNEIKKVLKDNNISSKELDKYIKLKALRYERYCELNELSDEEMIEKVNDNSGTPGNRGGRQIVGQTNKRKKNKET